MHIEAIGASRRLFVIPCRWPWRTVIIATLALSALAIRAAPHHLAVRTSASI